MIERRRVGLTLLIAGGLMVSFAGTRYVQGAVAQDEARTEWEAQAARAALNHSLDFANRAPGFVPVTGAPVARLVIPRIRLDEIVLEGVDDNTLNGGPGHLPGTPLPGDRGNAVVSAHRDRHFRNLGSLAVGDTVVTQSNSGTSTWVIVKKRIVDKDRPVLFQTADATLTLTTCWPIQYLGTAPDRLILSLELRARSARKS
jgi:sortase A